MSHSHSFDPFFASGLEESASPFLTLSSKKWGAYLSLKSSLLAAFLLLLSFLLSFSFLPLAHLLLTFVFFLVGVPAFIESFEDTIQGKINIHLLMTLSAFISLGISREFEGALLLVLFELSSAMEEQVTQKAKGAVQDLHELSPSKAWVVQEGGYLLETSVKEIAAKTPILVKVGEIVPLDGKVIEGISHYSIAHLTGESLPIKSHPGVEIPAGAKILDQPVLLEVTRTSNDSTLMRILNLITQAAGAKPKVERFLDRWGEAYAMGIIGLTCAFALLLPWLFSLPFLGYDGSIYRALTFMIAASPCALIIATPTAYLSAISACARKGILLKGGVTLDALARCQSISFDKTGTLTTGSLEMTEMICLQEGPLPFSNELALQIAYALERNVVHPISSAILELAKRKNLSPYPLDTFRAEPGRGLYATVGIGEVSYPVFLGLPEAAWQQLSSSELSLLKKKLSFYEGEKLISLLLIGKTVFLLTFTDEIRKEAKQAIEILKKKSMHTLMLTGDHLPNAEKVGKLLAIHQIYAELRPEKKLEMVANLSEQAGLAMVGDGVNDAPSLARATVGISMGTVGSTAAIEASDVILLKEDLLLIPWLLQKAKATVSIVRQNLSFALFIILFTAAFALYGFIPLWLAVLLHEGGTILVGLNSLRLLKK